MLSGDSSCSDGLLCPDCKKDLCERRWKQVLLNWINTCVLPGSSYREMTLGILLEALRKYKDDMDDDDLNQVQWTEDLEPFLRRKYPVWRLRNHVEAEDELHQLYTMASIIVYHCCVNSQSGGVFDDIYRMDNREQELILKFCENLRVMAVTVSHVGDAVIGAFDRTPGFLFNKPNFGPSRKVPSFNTESSCDSESSQNVTSTGMDSKPGTPAVNLNSSVHLLMCSSTEKTNGTKEPSSDDASKNERTFKDCKKSTIRLRNNVTKEANQLSCTNQVVQAVERTQTKGGGAGCACLGGTGRLCCCIPGKSMAADCSPKIAPGITCREWGKKKTNRCAPCKWILLAGVIVTVIVAAVMLSLVRIVKKPAKTTSMVVEKSENRFPRDDVAIRSILTTDMHWECRNKLCQKLHETPKTGQFYPSLSRCTLLCTVPQLWPYPTGDAYFSKQLVAIAKTKLEYKFQSVPSVPVHQHLAQAFNIFLINLAKLEKNHVNVKNKTQDLPLKKIYIQMDVESDPDPRVRVDTEESYQLQIDTSVEQIKVTITSPSFCGLRHGLETLSQLILLDQSTGFLITLSRVAIADSPSYKYRGLMIDTARNYIPIPDLMRTVDAMASCKLNTFHWRISDATSFPLLMPDFPQLFEFGGYDRSMVYTVNDIKALVDRAAVRGIRVLLEVASPGPVGKAWSWAPDTTSPSTTANFTGENALCLKLKMTDTILNILESIYKFIIEVTKVDDIFHMSNGVFSYARCYYTQDDREDFLGKSLGRLKIANKGRLPGLPIVWYTEYLARAYDRKMWKKFGVQLNEWKPELESQYLNEFKIIHSSKWDLSCEIKKRRCTKYRTWQEMYAWKSWRDLEVLTVKGGEAILWTDLVDSSNLDAHLWPRAAAVAERLWSDEVANHTAGANEYLRLDAHRWRMLMGSVKVEPIWPVWCSFNPGQCLKKIQ